MQENKQQKKRRTEILESAKNVFSSTSFHKAEMNEIAKRANIAKGTIYLYFPSKKELFRAVIKDGLEKLSQKIGIEVENIGDPVGKIKKAISTYMMFFNDHHALYRILIHPDLALMENMTDTITDIKLSKLPHLAETIKKGIDAGQIRDIDEDAVSYMILGMVDLLLLEWLSHPNPSPIGTRIDQVYDVLFKGILND